MSASLKSLLRFLCASATVILALAALNFIVDPLQLLRSARWFVPMYSPDSRMQDAGLIRSQDFDTVFMGTSLAIHFRQSDIDRQGPGRAVIEARNDGFKFARAKLRSRDGNGASSEASDLANR